MECNECTRRYSNARVFERRKRVGSLILYITIEPDEKEECYFTVTGPRFDKKYFD